MIRSVVKHRYFKGKKAEQQFKRYINYLTYREEHNLALNERVFFNRDEDAIHPTATTKFMAKSVYSVLGHELILSPGVQSVDTSAYTRELMAKLEKSLGTQLSWVAIEHKGKHNHVHVLIDGEASGKRIRLGLTDYQRLREWGDLYLRREHQYERYLDKEIDLSHPYQRDVGDCLFESLFETKQEIEKEVIPEMVDHFKAWSKQKAIAELADEEKIYEFGKAYSKYSTFAELASLQNSLRISVKNLPVSQSKLLKEWITEKQDFGDDHHERLAREQYARLKRHAQSNKRLVSIQTPTVSNSNYGDRKPMLQTNQNRSSTDSVVADDALAQKEQDRLEQESQVRQRQIEEDARLAQARAHEDKLWQANNKREEEFLKTLVSESPDFKEWAEEARRLREMQEEKRAEERKLYDEKLVEARLEQEKTRQEELDREQEEQDARDLEAEEALKQERRDEDERLAQLQKEDEQWRKRENDAIAERAQEEEFTRREETSKIQSEDDRARIEEYDVDDQRKEQQLQIEAQQKAREYKIQNEQQTRQFAADCKSSMDKKHSPLSDRGALRFERRPFKQRIHEEKGRQLQWHIRHQNSATRMMLNQQIEAEADAAKKEQLRNQLDELNRAEQEQLRTEVEPVDLDAIANEYLRPDLDEEYSHGRFIDADRSTDPDALSKQWRSPLDSAPAKKGPANEIVETGSGTKNDGDSRDVTDTATRAMPDQSFSDRVDRYAEDHWPSVIRGDTERDELSGFLNIEDEPRMKFHEMERHSESTQMYRQERQVIQDRQESQSLKKEVEREDDIFGR